MPRSYFCFLLIWVSGCLCDHHSTPPSMAEKSPGAAASASPEPLPRAKRSWVWNQFFVIEEYAGPEPVLIGKLHSDADRGEGRAKYVLTGEGAGTVFVIDEKTGNIHVTKTLDREEKGQYTLLAQAVDRQSNRPLEPPSEFIIKVQDINDNPPTFLQGPYHATVPEMSNVGTSVIQVTANDADDPTYGNSARLVYTVLEGQPFFSVDPQTDLYQFSVVETASSGSQIGRLRAHDPDVGENAMMAYAILDEEGAEAFTMSTDSQGQDGILTVRKPLDFESRRSYNFRVEVTNTFIDPQYIRRGPFKDVATVRISVEDADEPPLFSQSSYLLSVHENGEAGALVGRVSATDLDSKGSIIRYSIDRHSDPERFFTIDPQNGTISTAMSLDREAIPWHNITVVATELDSPSQASRVQVSIQTLDINDNAPQFQEAYDAFVCDNAQPGQLIQMVRAVDPDDHSHDRPFFFRGLPGLTNDRNFTIRDNKDNSASVLLQHGRLSQQRRDVYLVPIEMTDSGRPPLSSTGTLTVSVCQCGHDGTVLSCSMEPYMSPAGLSTGALVAILACIITLLAIVVLFVALRKQKKDSLIIYEEEDVRENIITYDDEGGGEEDTEAFDMAALQNPNAAALGAPGPGMSGGFFVASRRDVLPKQKPSSRHGQPARPAGAPDMEQFLGSRLREVDEDPSVPPYDSIQIYGYEGQGSSVGTLSALESSVGDSDMGYEYLEEWGPRFQTLADLYGAAGPPF
ncbi:cadherin-24 isoform X2 [Ambystoma mexicanum]|uniref:cadherin-24 isoform X2 n=1 Tax=Ambystoma mexicanum TaxID=8296 RepID=UPI0037E90AE7